MKRIFGWILLCGLFLPVATGAQVPAVPSSPGAAAATRAEMLDRLFARLRQAKDADSAKRVEQNILDLLRKSGNATADLLLRQAMSALAADQYDAALDILDTLIDQYPEFTEAVNQRATAYYLLGDYERSAADIAEVLAAEPRHFGALAGLGLVRREQGRELEALKAFRDALAVHPQMTGARQAADELAAKLEKQI
jgi:tetratricopeptide (TPR) repeat protein